jgi:hypothetical protein
MQQGFNIKSGYLHKRNIYFLKDYLNYYVSIVEEEPITEEYFDMTIGRLEEMLKNNKKWLNKNNVLYLFFFKRDITDNELDLLKNAIINQDVMQNMPGYFDTILPIVYDTAEQKYMAKALNRKDRFSIKPIQIALRKFYKIINQN